MDITIDLYSSHKDNESMLQFYRSFRIISIVLYEDRKGRIYGREENRIIIYQTEDGQTQINIRLENETVWLTQKQIAELFGIKRPLSPST